MVITTRNIIRLGITSGLLGMISMDIVMVIEFLLTGYPPQTYLELIGSILGGGAILGIPMHLLLSIVLGLAFTFIAARIRLTKIESVINGLIIGFLAGVSTIVGCVPFSSITGEPLWLILKFSVLPHIVFGIVWGITIGYSMSKLKESSHGLGSSRIGNSG